MPFRNLASWTGRGGNSSLEPDQNSGLWRNVTPVRGTSSGAARAITSEDVMRGVIIHTAAAVFTMPDASHLLADYPDWPIEGSVVFGIFGSTAAISKTINPGVDTTLAVGSGTAIAGACFVMLWRDTATTFKYALLRASL